MHRTMSVLLAGLMLMVVTAIALPNTVEAKKVGALVVGVGTTQTLSVYYVNVHSAPPHQSEPGVAGVHIVLQNPNPPDQEEGCTQTIHAQVNVNPRELNSLKFEIISEEEGVKKLRLNGVDQEPALGDCFDETNRVVYVLGEPNAVEFHEPGSPASPSHNSSGITDADVLGLMEIENSNGATATSRPIAIKGVYLIAP